MLLKRDGIIFVVVIALLIGTTAFGAGVIYKGYPGVKVFVDGQELTVTDVPAFIIDGRTVVPLRMVADAFNAKVEWDALTQSVKIKKSVETEKESPKKELITVEDLSIKGHLTNHSEITGFIKNENTDTVKVKITIIYYDSFGEIGHFHITPDPIAEGEKISFSAIGKGNYGAYTSKEIIIDSIEWN